MDWFILGIEPTKDKNAITAAYRQKLRQTNPEDKPEEFKALRTAYEEAVAFADQADTVPARDESPVGLWMGAVAKLYDDYASRIDPACWKELMASDVCVALDRRTAAEEALLKFLMERYYLPKAVWQVLDDTFQFSQRTEELYEVWPREFIDHVVMAGIRLEPALDYELFTPRISGTDCDAYRRLYHSAAQAALEEVEAILDQMDALSEHHPYGEALRYRFYMATDRAQEGKDGFRRLADIYPDDASLAIAWAELCLEDGNAEEAERIATHILHIEPKHIGAKAVCAKCLAAKKQYHEAKEYAYEVLHIGLDSPMLMEQMTDLMKSWNEQLIVQREAQYAKDPTDTNNAIELAWCYVQNERVEDAMALAQKIDPNCEDAFAYNNLMGKLYQNIENHAEALPYLQNAETILRNMTDDGTDETRKRLARLPEMLQIQGHCLMQLGRTAKQRENSSRRWKKPPKIRKFCS